MINKRYVVIILAAGKGLRINSKIPKQFIKLKKKHILAYTIEKFNKNINIEEIILVVDKNYLEFCKKEIVEKYNYTKVKQIIEGGKERQDSAYRGLKKIKKADYVIIHDGARPFIKESNIDKLIKVSKKYNNCILGVKLKDTIKICNNNIVEKTLNRDKMWLIQTPQCFKYETLIKAYKISKKNKYIVTDDASLLEYIGEKVYIVESDYFNIKITTKEDLKYAEFLLENEKLLKENI